jgi:hypothetical protein
VKFETPPGCRGAAFRLNGYPRGDELIYVSHTVSKRHVARVALRNDETLVLLICRSELIDGDPPREQQKTVLRRAFGEMKWEVPLATTRAIDGATDAADRLRIASNVAPDFLTSEIAGDAVRQKVAHSRFRPTNFAGRVKRGTSSYPWRIRGGRSMALGGCG